MNGQNSRLFSDIKRFIKYIQKRSYLIECIILILLAGFIIYQVNTNKILLSRIEKTEKKVDFRYFNTTRSLEDIHNVEIETRQGRVIKLIPKQ